MSKPEALPPHSVAPDSRPLAEQPAWRREVPIDRADEERVNRRAFLRTGLATGGALLATQALAASWRSDPPTPRRRIAGPEQLQRGAVLLFHYPDDHNSCLLIRTGPGATDYVAYEQACTHLRCPVVPQPEQGRLFCPCHNGAFDLADGTPIQGPPRRRLPRILLSFESDGIYAIGRRIDS